LDPKSQSALAHLKEQADFVRVLGSYLQKSRLVGPVKESVENLKNMPDHLVSSSSNSLVYTDVEDDLGPLNIGIVGLGPYGQMLARRFSKKHIVSCLSQEDKSKEARAAGAKFFPHYEMSNFLNDLDIVVLAVPMIDFERTVQSLPAEKLRGKLVVEVCPLNVHPKTVLLQHCGPDVDVLVSHPMLSPTDKEGDLYSLMSWDGRPMVYERVRITDFKRCDTYLRIFEEGRCQMVEMSAEQHDQSTADAEFVTHLTGRLLDRPLLPPTPVISKEYAALCDLAEMTSSDSFDLFFGMFKYNKNARRYLNQMRDNLSLLEQQLAAKDAYLAASAEQQNSDRRRLYAEIKELLYEIVASDGSNTQGTSSPSQNGGGSTN